MQVAGLTSRFPSQALGKYTPTMSSKGKPHSGGTGDSKEGHRNQVAMGKPRLSTLRGSCGEFKLPGATGTESSRQARCWKPRAAAPDPRLCLVSLQPALSAHVKRGAGNPEQQPQIPSSMLYNTACYRRLSAAPPIKDQCSSVSWTGFLKPPPPALPADHPGHSDSASDHSHCSNTVHDCQACHKLCPHHQAHLS